MQFVALDLETTGLDPKTDTIIEIAAIKFNIELEGDIFVMKNAEERSMLIHPNRLLEQEVTMITGITNDMLAGRPHFDEVRDKVRDFIGNAIIVGHNVLFDIAMFSTHEIDLNKNIVIDTFELSEIFSQDVESLNLGFLANRYGLIDPNEVEHRALTDTSVSIRLLMKYLGEVRILEGKKKQIWNTLIEHDSSQTLSTISKICHQIKETNLFSDFLSESTPFSDETIENIEEENQDSRILYEIHGNPHEELEIIKNAFKTHTHISLLTPGYKATLWMSEFLTSNNIENMVTIPYNKWCSMSYVQDLLLGNEIFGRKKLILILKISFWMTETKTGLLDELKFYGEERNMLDIFRTEKDEIHIWRKQYEKKIKNTPILISDVSNGESKNRNRYTLIKDIPLLEDIIRRRESKEISFDQLYSSIEKLQGDKESQDIKIHMLDMVSMIRGIYESIPERPTGPLVSPPGAYGETYFITQKMLWHTGHKWLVHAGKTLEIFWKKWKAINNQIASREMRKNIEHIDYAIEIFSVYHTYQSENINITLNINLEKTKITLIPRSVKVLMTPILKGAIGYGINIMFPQTKGFLIREYGYTPEEFSDSKNEVQSKTKIKYIEYHPDIIIPGTVILTTSQKHARDIGQDLRKVHGKNIEILIQGLSGGKGKMLSIFKNKTEGTILIGLIDTWRDEYRLWESARSIIIAKLPFDPPTDPYFLARTVGMSNNFSEYSEPIVTIRINTLIERVLSGGFTGSILATDSRLINTEWGKRIIGELL
ncbi:hypothetical protein HOO68_00510 [Candidatus Gracilibacteria bacterium]|nr:hypothetical protein [Candidatus Gracilibacteria bacterium]